MPDSDHSTILREQQEYYCARAGEYDQWWLRQGRYDRGPEANAQWHREGQILSSALTQFRPRGRILELACGTGIWTEALLPFATTVTAVDGSAEMLSVNAARLRSPNVQYTQANLFEWETPEKFDTIFFGFWLSHVPPEEFARFWERLRSWLTPGGRVFFVDSRREPTSTATDHKLPEVDNILHLRRLNDGREFQVYKLFYAAADLEKQLGKLGWRANVQQTDNYFLFGEAEPFDGEG